VVALLRTAATEGRLDVDELDQRIEAAFSAKTRGELARLLDDLPAIAPLAPAGHPPMLPPPAPPPRYWEPFVWRWRAPVDPHRAANAILGHVGPSLQAYGYNLVFRTHDRLVFRREDRPWWTILLAVLLFPLGLLALLHKEQQHVTVELVPQGAETAITVTGNAPLHVRGAFTAMER
jgi:hypothetical protein